MIMISKLFRGSVQGRAGVDCLHDAVRLLELFTDIIQEGAPKPG